MANTLLTGKLLLATEYIYMAPRISARPHRHHRGLLILVLCSGFLVFLHAASRTTAKKYYPTYRKPGQLLQTQPQLERGYHQQLYQSPLPTIHGSQANEVQRMSSYYAKKRAQGQVKSPVHTPSYPNVHTYSSYKKPTKSRGRVRQRRPVDRDDDDAEDGDEEDDEETNSTTTPKPKGPRQPPIGGFTLLLRGNTTADSEDEDDDEEEEDEDPFGFTEVELSLIPGVKYSIPRKHDWDWWGAQVQLSYPITFFFANLDFPEDSPPFPFGQRLFRTQLLRSSQMGTRERDKRSILSLPPTNTLRGGERAHLIPRLEKLLESTAGIRNGRDCLLKLVCEVHENQVHRSHGFFGELLTLVFSISRSSFSATHMPSYLEAEKMGRVGNCSLYKQKCPHSLFGLDDGQNQCESRSACNSNDYDYESQFGDLEIDDEYADDDWYI